MPNTVNAQPCRVSITTEEAELLRVTKSPSGEYIITGSLGVCTWTGGYETVLASYVSHRMSTNRNGTTIVTNNMMLPEVRLARDVNEATLQLDLYFQCMRYIVSIEPM
jgi:hypothetical protein